MVPEVESYLKRISYQDEIQISPRTLARLHSKHLRSVPFENLDIHLGRKIFLDLTKIEGKIITNERGGFCYELNGLFGALLKQLGFDVKMISARVCEGKEIGQEFDHMVLIVNLGEEWLVDVGFGEGFLKPIRMEVGEKQRDPAGYFRIERHDTKYLRLEFSKDDFVYETKYLFTRMGRQLKDFNERCEYHQTIPESPFTRGRVCSRATKNGRITLSDHSLIEIVNGHKTRKPVKDEVEYKEILRDRFGIVIR